ncbi:MAG: ATP-binding protein [Planctomycetota bacterium]|jgi:hypothetical protein
MSKPLRRGSLSCFAVALAAGAAMGASTADVVREEIQHADTYYWLGMAEKGNMDAFRRGMSHVDRAEKLLSTAVLPDETAARLGREIEALRGDIENQAGMARDTLYGVFPLVRLLAPSLFADAAATGTFELIHDPNSIAVSSANTDLCESILQEWKSQPQFDVVFTSVPRDEALENEARYIFNGSPKFFVHSRREVAGALSPEEDARYRAGEVTPAAKSRLCEAFGVRQLLVVSIEKRDIVDGDHFYTVEARLHTPASDKATRRLSRMGFCRDRRSQFLPIVVATALLLLAAVAVFAVMVRLRRGSFPALKILATVPVVGFVLGRILPWAIAPLVSTIAPDAENLARLSFWWPCAAGAALLLGPILVYRIASARVQHLSQALGMDGKGGAVFAAVATGTAAYLLVPLFLYRRADAVVTAVPLIIAVGLVAYVLGRTLDKADPFPVHAWALPVVSALGTGAAYAHASPAWLWLVVLLTVCGGALIEIQQWTVRRRTQPDGEPAMGQGEGRELAPPVDMEEFISRAGSPPYREFPTYGEAVHGISPAFKSRTAWLALSGDQGIGKTATARAVIAGLRTAVGREGGRLVLLAGECPEKMGEGTPYAPFQKALSRHFKVDLLASPEEQLSHIDSALDQLFDSVVPFSGLLFPSSEDSQNSAGSREEVFASVARTIEKLAARNTVVLLLDDVQWIDEGSRALLTFLLDRFPRGGDVPLLIIVTGREGLPDTDMGDAVLEVTELSRKQRVEMLVHCFGLRDETADVLAGKVGSMGSDEGQLHWLFRVVEHLARSNVFTRETDGRFTWAPGRGDPDKLPLPDDYRAAVEEQLGKFPQYRSLLECGACLGLEFRATVLSSSLERPRLEVLGLLREIEDRTGILYDVRGSDDCYAFRSSFMLEVIRESLSISGLGPEDGNVPQIIREYHARVAGALEGTLEESSNARFEVAKHYYAAGASKVGKALNHCLKAARAASTIFEHSQARRYLAMARECARVLKKVEDTEEEFLSVECHVAHVEGSAVGSREAAEKCLARLERHPEASTVFLITTARACYDAAGAKPELGAETTRIARLIVNRARTPVERAEGYHFLGVSLPREDAKGREENLRKALGILQDADERDLPAQALLARVSNSLAVQLENGPPEGREEAKRLFERRIEINRRPESRDRLGMAMGHEGLGRLARAAGDIAAAREHFRMNLQISEEVGNVVGQCMMHNFLGDFDLGDGRADEAIRHYRASFDVAEGGPGKLFAGARLLKGYCASGRRAEIDIQGVDLLNLAREEGIASYCAADLTLALEECSPHTEAAWLGELRGFVARAAGDQ